MQLLLGCGRNREKKLGVAGRAEWSGLVTLDSNPDHRPDVLHDLNDLPLPFGDGSAEEIHAYEVLEHCGRQGDWRFFFDQWSDFWRVLEPGGLFFGTVPNWRSPWAWGDPSHTRVLPLQCLTFLDQSEYQKQVGATAMSDFRHCYKADLEMLASGETEHEASFVLRARK